jgi:YD repeat-containing protein
VDSGKLEKDGTGWTYSSKHNDRYKFGNDGNLLHQKVGNQELTLTTQGNVTIVTDSHGKTLEIQSTAEGQLAQVKQEDLTVTYHYNSDKILDTVNKQIGGSSQLRFYQYTLRLGVNLLKSIKDETGTVFSEWNYDESGRAISSQHTGNTQHVGVIYNPDGSTTVVNEYGKRSNYRYQYINGVNRITSIEGEPSSNCPSSNSTMAYDNKGQITTHTDARGNVTTYDYNDRGLETSRTEASGTPQARTVITEWHPTLFLKTKVTEPNRITTYQYDAQGRQTGQIVTPR